MLFLDGNRVLFSLTFQFLGGKLIEIGYSGRPPHPKGDQNLRTVGQSSLFIPL
jgi:hypothetical protein